MQKVDLAELRRIWADGEAAPIRWAQNAAAIWSALPALLDELEAARAENERLTDVIFQGEGIDATGELGITRENFREWIDARDCRMKLIGAAEGLELVAGEWSKRGRDRRFHAQELLERAAKLWQEAEGK